jgi:hypothetical protein
MTYTSTGFEEFFMLRRKITPPLVKRQIAQDRYWKGMPTRKKVKHYFGCES